MNDFNVIVEQETVQYFSQRQRLRQGLNQARNQVQILEQFSSCVPASGQATQISSLTSKATPPAELQAVLPELERSVENMDWLNASIHEKYVAIEEIQRQASAQKAMLTIGVVIIGIILFVILLFATHII
jgi:hypothetical protein